MLIPLILMVSVFSPFAGLFGSVEVTVQNNLLNSSITQIHYLLSGSSEIINAGLDSPIPPGGFSEIALPRRYLARLVFGTEEGVNYRKAHCRLGADGDTLTVSRADMEFGGYFDVIMGSRVFVIQNRTPVPIRALYLDSLCGPGIMGANPLMTDEVLFLWHDSDSLRLIAVDIEGNPSKPIMMIRSEDVNSFAVGIEAFLEGAVTPHPGAITVINGVNGESIVGIEVYPLDEEPFFFDLSDTPLGLWQSAVIPFTGRLDYLVCIDESNRAFIVDSRDESTGAYVVDWWHLEFDFSFRERRI